MTCIINNYLLARWIQCSWLKNHEKGDHPKPANKSKTNWLSDAFSYTGIVLYIINVLIAARSFCMEYRRLSVATHHVRNTQTYTYMAKGTIIQICLARSFVAHQKQFYFSTLCAIFPIKQTNWPSNAFAKIKKIHFFFWREAKTKLNFNEFKCLWTSISSYSWPFTVSYLHFDIEWIA